MNYLEGLSQTNLFEELSKRSNNQTADYSKYYGSPSIKDITITHSKEGSNFEIFNPQAFISQFIFDITVDDKELQNLTLQQLLQIKITIKGKNWANIVGEFLENSIKSPQDIIQLENLEKILKWFYQQLQIKGCSTQQQLFAPPIEKAQNDQRKISIGEFLDWRQNQEYENDLDDENLLLAMSKRLRLAKDDNQIMGQAINKNAINRFKHLAQVDQPREGMKVPTSASVVAPQLIKLELDQIIKKEMDQPDENIQDAQDEYEKDHDYRISPSNSHDNGLNFESDSSEKDNSQKKVDKFQTELVQTEENQRESSLKDSRQDQLVDKIRENYFQQEYEPRFSIFPLEDERHRADLMRDFKIYNFEFFQDDMIQVVAKSGLQVKEKSQCFFKVTSIASEPYVVKMIYFNWLNLIKEVDKDLENLAKHNSKHYLLHQSRKYSLIPPFQCEEIVFPDVNYKFGNIKLTCMKTDLAITQVQIERQYLTAFTVAINQVLGYGHINHKILTLFYSALKKQRQLKDLERSFIQCKERFAMNLSDFNLTFFDFMNPIVVTKKGKPQNTYKPLHIFHIETFFYGKSDQKLKDTQKILPKTLKSLLEELMVDQTDLLQEDQPLRLILKIDDTKQVKFFTINTIRFNENTTEFNKTGQKPRFDRSYLTICSTAHVTAVKSTHTHLNEIFELVLGSSYKIDIYRAMRKKPGDINYLEALQLRFITIIENQLFNFQKSLILNNPGKQKKENDAESDKKKNNRGEESYNMSTRNLKTAFDKIVDDLRKELGVIHFDPDFLKKVINKLKNNQLSQSDSGFILGDGLTKYIDQSLILQRIKGTNKEPFYKQIQLSLIPSIPNSAPFEDCFNSLYKLISSVYNISRDLSLTNTDTSQTLDSIKEGANNFKLFIEALDYLQDHPPQQDKFLIANQTIEHLRQFRDIFHQSVRFYHKHGLYRNDQNCVVKQFGNYLKEIFSIEAFECISKDLSENYGLSRGLTTASQSQKSTSTKYGSQSLLGKRKQGELSQTLTSHSVTPSKDGHEQEASNQPSQKDLINEEENEDGSYSGDSDTNQEKMNKPNHNPTNQSKIQNEFQRKKLENQTPAKRQKISMNEDLRRQSEASPNQQNNSEFLKNKQDISEGNSSRGANDSDKKKPTPKIQHHIIDKQLFDNKMKKSSKNRKQTESKSRVNKQDEEVKHGEGDEEQKQK